MIGPPFGDMPQLFCQAFPQHCHLTKFAQIHSKLARATGDLEIFIPSPSAGKQDKKIINPNVEICKQKLANTNRIGCPKSLPRGDFDSSRDDN